MTRSVDVRSGTSQPSGAQNSRRAAKGESEGVS